MNIVTAYVPVFESGYVIAQMEVTVRPSWDDALGGLIADVSFLGENGHPHPFPDERAKEILADIKRYQPEVWAEIEEKAEDEFLEGCEPDYSHYAEDYMEEFACPR